MSTGTAREEAVEPAPASTAAVEDAVFAALTTAGTEAGPGSDAAPCVRHASGADPDQFIEVHGDPASASAVVVFVHGGYFRERTDLTHARPLARALAAEGVLCVLVEYRRRGGQPHCLDDVSAGIGLALDSLTAWGVSAEAAAAPVVAGHSAGGCLVLGWASHLGESGPRIRLRPLSPVTDLHREVAHGLGEGAVLEYMGVRPEEDPPAYARHDPRSRILFVPERVEVLIVHGDADATVDVDFTRTFPAPHRILPGAHHADLVDPDAAAFAEVRTLLLGT